MELFENYRKLSIKTKAHSIRFERLQNGLVFVRRFLYSFPLNTLQTRT